MGSFIFVSYTGEDAGAIVAHMLMQDTEEETIDNPDKHNLTSNTERAVGFQPNDPEAEEDDEDE